MMLHGCTVHCWPILLQNMHACLTEPILAVAFVFQTFLNKLLLQLFRQVHHVLLSISTYVSFFRQLFNTTFLVTHLLMLSPDILGILIK